MPMGMGEKYLRFDFFFILLKRKAQASGPGLIDPSGGRDLKRLVGSLTKAEC